MYINIGAYVGEGTLVDSHALVGSCAQVGARVHLSAGAQIGGVIEPVGALPVIIEDDVLVGGNTGIYEGIVVRARAVIAAGTVMTGSTPLYDLPNGCIVRADEGQPWSSRRAPSWYPAHGPSPWARVPPGACRLRRR
jgi:2,3,4,5-tetrahydropyridine-2-carboxylate N-succinyltransferase